jgi:selenocysteine lyase/cysteine desulfurase
MLPTQRALFDIPPDVCYLNAAAWTPLPRVTQDAGHAGVARKGQPWALDPGLGAEQHERARAAAARLIGAAVEDVALISSISYGVAIAGKLVAPALVTPRLGTRVLLMEEDHSSPSLEWMTRVPAQVEVVKRPDDGDWTGALLAAIERPGAAPVGLASFSSVHWSDGSAIDLARIGAALRAQGAIWLIDATQSVGVLPLDVAALDPDFVVFPTYKWLLGPYGRAFIYIAKRWQNGVPLEQTGAGRVGVNSESTPYMRDIGFVSGARRFDMGERDHLITLGMASVSMELVASWGAPAIAARLRQLTDRLEAGLKGEAVRFPAARLRAPHLLSLQFPAGMPGDFMDRLHASGVYVAARLGRLRVSPHVYNTEDDIDRFLSVFRASMG